jgi:hypothetical protein
MFVPVKKGVDEGSGHRSLADGGRHSLDGTVAQVSCHEDARLARLEVKRVAVERPPRSSLHLEKITPSEPIVHRGGIRASPARRGGRERDRLPGAGGRAFSGGKMSDPGRALLPPRAARDWSSAVACDDREALYVRPRPTRISTRRRMATAMSWLWVMTRIVVRSALSSCKEAEDLANIASSPAAASEEGSRTGCSD